MKNYKKDCLLQVALIAVGAGLVGLNVAQQSGNPLQFNPWIATGIVIGGSSYFLQSAKKNEKWFAVDTYNASAAQ